MVAALLLTRVQHARYRLRPNESGARVSVELDNKGEPIRIVCTKCVRIARVLFQERSAAHRAWLVALECCERRVGWVVSGLDDHPLTTNDFCPVMDLDNFIDENEKDAEAARTRAKWARWVRVS